MPQIEKKDNDSKDTINLWLYTSTLQNVNEANISVVDRGAIEWVSDYCLTLNKQLFRNTMVRISYTLMRWWCTLCTRPTRFV
jgi:hypothetical protein